MAYAQGRVERLVLAIPLAKRSQTLSCSGIIRTCWRCLKYYLTAKNTASPANSPSWLDLDSVPLLINGELPALTATTGAVYWPNRIGGGVLGGKICSSIRLLAECEPVFLAWNWLPCIYKGLAVRKPFRQLRYELYSLGGLGFLPFWWMFLFYPGVKYYALCSIRNETAVVHCNSISTQYSLIKELLQHLYHIRPCAVIAYNVCVHFPSGKVKAEFQSKIVYEGQPGDRGCLQGLLTAWI